MLLYKEWAAQPETRGEKTGETHCYKVCWGLLTHTTTNFFNTTSFYQHLNNGSQGHVGVLSFGF